MLIDETLLSRLSSKLMTTRPSITS